MKLHLCRPIIEASNIKSQKCIAESSRQGFCHQVFIVISPPRINKSFFPSACTTPCADHSLIRFWRLLSWKFLLVTPCLGLMAAVKVRFPGRRAEGWSKHGVGTCKKAQNRATNRTAHPVVLLISPGQGNFYENIQQNLMNE